ACPERPPLCAVSGPAGLTRGWVKSYSDEPPRLHGRVQCFPRVRIRHSPDMSARAYTYGSGKGITSRRTAPSAWLDVGGKPLLVDGADDGVAPRRPEPAEAARTEGGEALPVNVSVIVPVHNNPGDLRLCL